VQVGSDLPGAHVEQARAAAGVEGSDDPSLHRCRERWALAGTAGVDIDAAARRQAAHERSLLVVRARRHLHGLYLISLGLLRVETGRLRLDAR
jgi:hypothetical protein